MIHNLKHLNSVDEAYVDDSIALLELVTNAHKGFCSDARETQTYGAEFGTIELLLGQRFAER